MVVETLEKNYTAEQNKKLTQFGMTCATAQFLYKRDSLLNQGYKYAVTLEGGDTTKPTIFDREMYLMVQGAAGKLFNQLMDMGLEEEVRGIIMKNSHPEEEQALQLDESQDRD